MRLLKSVILVLICLICLDGVAQRNSQKVSTKPRTIGSKKQARLLDPEIDNSRFPYHGFGIKLGDPFALSYKFYADKKFSFVIDIGKTGTGLYNKYYREKFYDYTSADTFAVSGSSIRYLTHKATADIVGEAKFLYHLSTDHLPTGLQPYVGLGWQWKNTTLRYSYLYNSPTVENSPGVFSRNRLTMGPQLVLGLEYAYFKVPVSAFLEMEYYRDVQADPGWHRFEGGVGLRYIF